MWIMPHGQSASCIYCDMEQETIIYYYPMPEEMTREENRYAAKKHWFQDASLKTALLARQEEFQVLGCAVPPFYYRRKPWKAQILSETMETVLGDASGMADTCLHPAVKALLTEEYCSKWMPRASTIRMFIKYLLEEYAGKGFACCSQVTVLLGRPEDTDRQMEMTWELLQPFLPRVNRMVIYYEKQEIPQRGEWPQRTEWEEADTESIPVDERTAEDRRGRSLPEGGSRRSRDVWEEASGEQEEQEELSEYLEDYYYEYGLVPQLEPYVKSRAQPSGESMTAGLKCGKAKCGGVILDYCGQFRYPRMLPEGGIYIDTVSVMEKERQLMRKGLSVPYLSPLKYLDTMVKNSYDRLVIKGEGVF